MEIITGADISSIRDDNFYKEMFADDFVGIAIDYNDPMDFTASVEMLFRLPNVYAMVDGGKIACFADVYKTSLGSAINIYTAEAYRGQGIAYTLAKHLVDNKLINRWVCATRNLPSQTLARKLGFVVKEATHKDIIYTLEQL